MGRFFPLIEVAVEHSYFTNGSCASLEFVPTESSLLIIRNAGLILRWSPGGAQLFYDDGSTTALKLLAADGETATLRFRVYSRDPLFMNYTRPPVRRDNAVLSFDAGAFSRELGGRLSLSREEFVSEADLRSLDAPLPDGLITAADRLLPPTFLLSVPLLAQGGDGEAPLPSASYLISFQARETLWKYYLLGDMAGIEGVIVDRNNGIAFESLGQEAVAGRSALVFRSTTPLPLRERSEYNFQLRANGAGGKILVRRLPVASPAQLWMEMINGEEAAVSEIYVNC